MSNKDAMAKVSNWIIEKLEQMRAEGKTLSWRKMWTGGNAGMGVGFSAGARAYSTGRPYRGSNVPTLAIHQWFTGCSSPYYLTFNAAKKLGGKVKPGSKGAPVIFWKQWVKETELADGTKKRQVIPLARVYWLFNEQQVDGLKQKHVPVPIEDQPTKPSTVLIEEATTFLTNLPGGSPDINYGFASACYIPSRDRIQVPGLDQYPGPDEFYSTLFHEVGHWTGAEGRSTRDGITKAGAYFGSDPYAEEELVAEFYTSMVCNMLGVQPVEATENQLAYLQGWLKKLKDDPDILRRAAKAAEAAATWSLSLKSETEESEEEEA